MIGYITMFKHGKDEFDICIKFDTITYDCNWYFRTYDKEFNAVNGFDMI